MRRMNFSAAGVMVSWMGMGRYLLVDGIQTLTMQPSTGHTATHCGSSKWPSHSVHLTGSMMKVPPFSRMATLGHSGSQAEQPVQVEAMIFKAMGVLLYEGWDVGWKQDASSHAAWASP